MEDQEKNTRDNVNAETKSITIPDKREPSTKKIEKAITQDKDANSVGRNTVKTMSIGGNVSEMHLPKVGTGVFSGMMDDFFVRNKLIRDTISQQVLISLGFFIKLMNLAQTEKMMDQIYAYEDKVKKDMEKLKEEMSNEDNGDNSELFNSSGEINSEVVEDGQVKRKIVVGILGAGLIGRIFIDFLNNRELFGRSIEVKVSTRVPEKLFGQKFEGMRIFYDNARLIKESHVILLCTPKHKSKYVFNSFREEYARQFERGRRKMIISVIGNMTPQKLIQMIDYNHDISTFFQINVDYKYMEEVIFKELLEKKKKGEMINLSDYTHKLVLNSMKPLLEELVFCFSCLNDEYSPLEEPELIDPAEKSDDWQYMFETHFMKNNRGKDIGRQKKRMRREYMLERRRDQLVRSKVLKKIFGISGNRLDQEEFGVKVDEMIADIKKQLFRGKFKEKKSD